MSDCVGVMRQSAHDLLGLVVPAENEDVASEPLGSGRQHGLSRVAARLAQRVDLMAVAVLAQHAWIHRSHAVQ